MIIYVDREDSLGDFVNCFPVLRGIYNTYGHIKLIVKSPLRRFNGFREFLMYQNIFQSVEFDDEPLSYHNVLAFHKVDYTPELILNKINENQPDDVYRYGKFMKKTYNLNFEIDSKWRQEAMKIKRKNLVIGSLKPYTTISYSCVERLLMRKFTLLEIES